MDKVIKAYWAAFLESRPFQTKPAEPADVFAFGNTSELAHALGALVVQGVKTATTSALWAYAEGEPLPSVGDLSIVISGDGRPLCVIQTTEVTVQPFSRVDAAFAHDEGEGDRSLVFWRAAHVRFFSETLTPLGRAFQKDMPVVCERFRVVYPREKLRVQQAKGSNTTL